MTTELSHISPPLVNDWPLTPEEYFMQKNSAERESHSWHLELLSRNFDTSTLTDEDKDQMGQIINSLLFPFQVLHQKYNDEYHEDGEKFPIQFGFAHFENATCAVSMSPIFYSKGTRIFAEQLKDLSDSQKNTIEVRAFVMWIDLPFLYDRLQQKDDRFPTFSDFKIYCEIGAVEEIGHALDMIDTLQQPDGKRKLIARIISYKQLPIMNSAQFTKNDLLDYLNHPLEEGAAAYVESFLQTFYPHSSANKEFQEEQQERKSRRRILEENATKKRE